MPESSRKQVYPMVTRLIEVTIVAAIAVVVINSLPDIKRYLEIRDM